LSAGAVRALRHRAAYWATVTQQTDRLSAALAGRYRIERRLGEGGMATVFLAEDLKHKRKVALKVLKPELAAVLGGERFVQEITTTASLQHPHILALFDSGTADGFLFYVMPWIDGETLREKLSRETQLGVDEAVRIAREVLDALEYAHQHGIVHRDIKPENILLHGGHALVADFGIALALSAAAGGRMTETGLSLGTPHYMSPEQATAEKEISARSDVYSLGCVLYEMLTGQPPHLGGSAQQIIMKIITEAAAPVTQLRKSVPPNVAAAVAKSLEKLPADRFESAKAFGDALGNPAYATAALTGAAEVHAFARAERGRLTIAGWAAASAVAATLAVGFFVGRRSAPAPAASPVHFTIELPDSVTSVNRCCGPAQALSPDGATLVFVGMKGGRGALYRRSRDRLAAEMIPGTDEGSIPFFSPDGQWLGFESGGQLHKVPISGGPVAPIATTGRVAGASWGEGDVIVYAGFNDDQLWQVPASGGKPSALTRGDSSIVYRYPSFLPGGKWALVAFDRKRGVLESTQVGVVELKSGKVDTIGLGTRGVYANGSLVFSGADNTLLVQPFDPSRRRLTGAATVILGGIAMHGSYCHEFSLSANGWLEYQASGDGGGTLLRVTGPGGRSVIALPGRSRDRPLDPAISPDGKRIALRLVPAGSSPGTAGDLWMFDRAQNTLTRFTVGGGMSPVWTRDGRRIAYYVPGDSGVKAGIYVRPVDETAAPTLVLAGTNRFPSSWLADGRSLVFTARVSAPNNYDIGIVALADSAPRWIVHSEFTEVNAQLSPDGRWLAYASDRTGKFELYVQPMAGGGAPVQVSSEGGTAPRWSPDGRTVYYVVGSSIVAATLAPGGAIAVASRKIVVEGGADAMRNQNVDWDLFPDGKQFLSIDQGGEGHPRLALVQHWPEMARAMGAKK
jgi:serine/threonine-protein kinase